MNRLDELKKIIDSYNDFAVVSHTSPDGDSMGSILSLYNLLLDLNKNVDVFVEGQAPNKFSFLNGFYNIKNVNQFNNKYECLFVLDCGDEDRLGDCKELIEKADIIVNIDHHITNTNFGNINLVDSKASSVGEMLYEIYANLDFNITRIIAECLYTSIVSDTGGFKFSNTSSKTMKIIANLIDTGINFTNIYYRIIDLKTLNGIKLMSKVTSTLKTYLDGKVATIKLTKQMLEECEATEDEAGELVNIARDIENVEVGILIKEIDLDTYKISFRSKDYFDVKDIALKYGGGGHIKAAGCTIKNKKIDEIESEIINEIKKLG
ncbi:bifunctional oligoribonuclease/PAP phosphatase NrnA [Caloramator sp. mosi_1]|uniref:DHH family phosphoesterase n=1 Tax=Caloramator sp. mosi_1 TaxID=3023090 RepID=UPI002362C316|nr:bifunctional oligoribonuclease/PAP phosphatase NrnA [Caloramator sp. mosi_1]WDC84007.1 bifunctional oligoribonuclease/PAP phosphatase NrnA [Caloramator sp. mosi_1]